MKETRAWILVVGILVIVTVAAFLVVRSVNLAIEGVRSSAQQAMQPVNDVADMTGGLATQVAQFLNPTPTVLPDPVTIVKDVRTLARLETIQYTVEKIVTGDRGQGSLEFLFGDQLLFVAHGVVIAGVDLAKVGTEDIWFESGVLHMRMPPAEIFIATLDNEKSYVYDRETGLFTRGDIQLESQVRRVAQESIEAAALEDGILEQARLNAENYLFRLLRDLGYPDVIFIWDEVPEE